MWSPPNVKTVGWSKSMKIFFGVTVFGIILLLILFILQQIPPYYSKLVWGTIIVIVGSAGSQLLPEWKIHKWLKWIRSVCIAIVIAFGALLTTLGWNERDNYINKKALLLAAAMEWKQNDMRNVEIENTLNLIRQEDYKTLYFFTFPTNRELTRVIDITQLERWRIQQSPLDLAIFEYTSRIDFLCTRLYSANISGGRPLKVYRKLIDSIFGRGDAYPDYLKYHNYVEKIIRKKYPGLLDRVDWMQRKMIDRRKERAGEITEPADPNDQPDDNSTKSGQRERQKN